MFVQPKMGWAWTLYESDCTQLLVEKCDPITTRVGLGGGGGARATRLNLEPDLFLFFKCSNLKAFRVSFRKEYLLSDSTWYQKMLAYSV